MKFATSILILGMFAPAAAAAQQLVTTDRRDNLMKMFKGSGSTMPLVNYFTPLHLMKGKNDRVSEFEKSDYNGAYIASAAVDPLDDLEDEETLLARERCKICPKCCAPFMRGRRAVFAVRLPTPYRLRPVFADGSVPAEIWSNGMDEVRPQFVRTGRGGARASVGAVLKKASWAVPQFADYSDNWLGIEDS